MSNMWADLKKTGSLPEKSALLSNCEVELSELMRQIDIMVSNKKLTWDRERQALEARTSLHQQEQSLTKQTLDKKHIEVGKLKQQVCEMESGQRELVTQYETQLSKMKNEVGTMKREYEKLKKLHCKHMSREKSKASTEAQDTQTDIKRLNGKVEEYRLKGRDWEQQKRTYTKQLEALESQKRTLEEKCDLIQHQTVGYQSQLDRRRDLLDSTEQSLRSQITQLEGQLERARDTVNSQDTQIARLRQTLEESVECQRKALEDKDTYEGELRHDRNKLRVVESELSACRAELESTCVALSQSEGQQQRLTRERHSLEQDLEHKEAKIHAVQKAEIGQQQQKLHVLQEDLNKSKEEIRKNRKQEKQYKEDSSCLQGKLEDCQEKCRRLQEELTQKTSEMSYFETTLIYKMRCQAGQLQDKLAGVEETHSASEAALKADIANMTSDIHQKNLSVQSLGDKLSSAERLCRENGEMLDRKKAEIQVCSAQLDALRLENRHLRKTALYSNSEQDQGYAENHLQELQNAYITSLSALEEQNSSLKCEIKSCRMKVSQFECSSDYDRTQAQHTDRAETGVKYLDSAGSSNGQQGEICRLQQLLINKEGHVQQLEQQLNHQNSTIKKLGMENDVMSHFVENVDHSIRGPNGEILDSDMKLTDDHFNSSGHYSHISSLEGTTLSDDDDVSDLLDPVDVVTAQFLADQEERTKELEKKLDGHIESLKIRTDATLRKYNT